MTVKIKTITKNTAVITVFSFTNDPDPVQYRLLAEE